MIRRYNSYNEVLKKEFGCRVQKVSITGPFSCPNRDGTLGKEGCIYCNNLSIRGTTYREGMSIKEQVEQGILYLKKRYNAKKFIAYFQGYTNTYAEVDTLRYLYNEALFHPDIVGLSIGTRPDCVPNPVLDLLAELSQKYYLRLELGLESSHDKTLIFINRGHLFSDFEDAVKRSKERKIKVCAHVIIGLPNEGRKEIIETAKELARLKIDEIKIHNLHVVKDTSLEKMYYNKEITLLSQKEYVELVVDFLENLSKETIIQRLTGEAPKDILVAPSWALNKQETLRLIEKELIERDTYQGRLSSY